MQRKYTHLIVIGLGLLIIGGISYGWTRQLSNQKEIPKAVSESVKEKSANEWAKKDERGVSQPSFNNSEQAVDTLDWKLYSNEKYGYEIKYPRGYFFEVVDVSSLDHVLDVVAFKDKQYENSSDPGELPQIEVVVYPNPEKTSLQKWFNRHSTTVPFGPSPNREYYFEGVTLVKKVTVDNHEGLYVEHEEMAPKAISILVSSDDKIVKIGNIFPSINQTFDRMISTFHLTR